MTAMDWREAVRAVLRDVTGDPASDEDIVEELAQHLALRYEEHRARGMDAAAARSAALAELRENERLAPTLRDLARRDRRAPVPPPVPSRPHLLADLLADVRYALRVIARNRGFSAAAMLTLALGIGATTAIFSVVNAVLLRPVPFAAPDRLALVWETDRNTGTTREPASYPDFQDLQQRSRQFGGLAAFMGAELTLTPEGAEPRRVAALLVTNDFLPLLGVGPVRGRVFTDDEDRVGGPAVVLISERLRAQLFAGDSAVIGRTVRLDDRTCTIVGVMPDDADFGVMQILRQAAYARFFADRDVRSRVDIWAPLQADPQEFVRATHPIFVVGRLGPGATAVAAGAEVSGIMADLEQRYPENRARGAWVEPMSTVVFGRVRPALIVLFSAVAVVLLIACVNVANLLLARGTTRLREVAVRTALGADVRRLARQFAVENLVLALAAAVVGVAIAFAGMRALLALAPADIPRLNHVAISGGVLATSFALAIASGLVFGMVPVMQARRLDLNGALTSEEARGSTAARARGWLRSTFVVAQVALAAMLVLGAGLLLKSFWRLSQVDPGFNAAGVVKAQFSLPASRYPTPGNRWPNFVEMNRFNADLERRAAALPGVQAAAVVANHPLDPGFTNSFVVVGREAEAHDWPEISVRRVSPAYFRTVRLGLVQGRLLGDADGTTAAPVGVINEAAARRFFADREPVGQQLRFWGITRTIVGIVADEHFQGITQPAPPAVYLPLAQAPSFDGAEVLLVRSDGPPASLAGPMRAAIEAIDPGLAVFGVEPLTRTLSESIGQQRFLMLLLALFAALALVLAAIGIHGVLSYTVARRRHELGIRLALGAAPGGVLRLVMAQGMRLAALGIVLGVAGALALSRFLASLLYGVPATDAATLLAVVVALAGVAAVATWVPARHAVRIDPLAAMRDE